MELHIGEYEPKVKTIAPFSKQWLCNPLAALALAISRDCNHYMMIMRGRRAFVFAATSTHRHISLGSSCSPVPLAGLTEMAGLIDVLFLAVHLTHSALHHSAFADDLIGMAPRAEAVENLLDLNSEDVIRVVGIHGMGGIGKMILAAVVYNKIFTPSIWNKSLI
ncbi:TMV resistance protein N isoform X1 [Senna tora]|uniref:TMV resistance protein N isoform X1 n=1 Tax=Senna tora TaxID=362788 RepID=A0A834W725_9FABA|nr:TMV resistance protein N isoform X1 [Senna tora]